MNATPNLSQVREAARGRWPEILANLGADPSFLDGKHHPCPACGGKDRFRFDDKDGNGSHICNQCGAGDGFTLAGKLLGLDAKKDFSPILERVADLTGATPTIPMAKPNRKKKPDAWHPLSPVPDDAPEPPRHYKMGEPSRRWTYRDTEGRALFHVCRFDKADGEKEVLPLSFCHNADGKRQWRWKGLPAPRPLYNLDGLAARPEAMVIVTEGEKAADAVAAIFPEWVPVTSPNGSGSAGKADWSPLAGRRVVIWPDHDDKGTGYADAVSAALRDVEAESVQWLRLEAFKRLSGLPEREELPEGWDAADAVAEGAGQETGKAFMEDPANLMPPRLEHEAFIAEYDAGVEAAEERRAETEAYEEARRKFPFEVVEWTKGRRNGTYFLPPADGDEQPEPVWICSPLHITARTRDAFQGNHGRLLEFHDPDGHRHAWAMPMSLLAGDGTELRSTLLSKGVEISTVRKARDWLAEYLQRSRPDAVARCVDRTGWHHGVFVFPDATLGETEERVLLQTVAGDLHGFEVAGTLTDWQREVAARCVGNSRLAFAVSAAFAAALLHLVGDESGGFNFTGNSSKGKTVALRVAVSVWGGPERLQRWRATSNGLEAVALTHNDTLLCLDELGQVDAREAGEIAYMLANGAGKARSNRDGTARRKASWQLLFLSSGEIGLAEHMRSAGKRSRAGQEVRLADIPADAGAGHGLFENLHNHPGGAAFAQALDRAARTCHGTAARAFIAGLVENPAGVAAAIEAFRREFMAETLPMLAPGREVDGQIHRVAGRFALVAAAGEMATAMGVAGWASGEAIRAARTCLEAWIVGRGGTGPKETEAALAQVRLFFEQHGESRFSPKDGNTDRPTINRAGFRSEVEGRTEWWVLPEVFRSEVCQGMDPRFVSRLLVERGWIKPEPGNSTTVKARLPGMGLARCYHFVAVGGGDEQ